jgi:hypothetical protein
MSAFITIDAKKLDLARIVLAEVKNGAPRAIQGTINTSLTMARRKIYGEIDQEFDLKKQNTRGKEVLSIQRARPDNLVGMLRFKSKALPLYNFGINPRGQHLGPYSGKLLRAEVIRGEVNQWRHAFTAKMKNGHWGVFTRSGKFTTRNNHNKKRSTWRAGKRHQVEIINQRYSVSVPQMVNRVLEYSPNLRTDIQAEVDNNLDRQLERLLKERI